MGRRDQPSQIAFMQDMLRRKECYRFDQRQIFDTHREHKQIFTMSGRRNISHLYKRISRLNNTAAMHWTRLRQDTKSALSKERSIKQKSNGKLTTIKLVKAYLVLFSLFMSQNAKRFFEQLLSSVHNSDIMECSIAGNFDLVK